MRLFKPAPAKTRDQIDRDIANLSAAMRNADERLDTDEVVRLLWAVLEELRALREDVAAVQGAAQ